MPNEALIDYHKELATDYERRAKEHERLADDCKSKADYHKRRLQTLTNQLKEGN